MSNHEERARELHRQGNNCSTSVHTAFSEDTKISADYPEPRSIEGKCGALITAEKILKDTGNEDEIEKFEKEFNEEFGYVKCIDLMTHERRCNDYVGWSSKKIDEILDTKRESTSSKI